MACAALAAYSAAHRLSCHRDCRGPQGQRNVCQFGNIRPGALVEVAKAEPDAEARNQLRAIERGGAIVAEVKASKGGRPKTEGRASPSLRQSAAKEAGVSPDQAKTMLRVNNVPAEEREALMEGDRPPPEAAFEYGAAQMCDPYA